MKLTLEEKVIILNKTVTDIENRNKGGNKYFLEGFRFGVTMAIMVFLEQELD